MCAGKLEGMQAAWQRRRRRRRRRRRWRRRQCPPQPKVHTCARARTDGRALSSGRRPPCGGRGCKTSSADMQSKQEKGSSPHHALGREGGGQRDQPSLHNGRLRVTRRAPVLRHSARRLLRPRACPPCPPESGQAQTCKQSKRRGSRAREERAAACFPPCTWDARETETAACSCARFHGGKRHGGALCLPQIVR